jgi:MYXO-CTERM domain-containing protein
MRKFVWVVCLLGSVGGAIAAETAADKAAPTAAAAVPGVATWGADQKVDKTQRRDEYGGRACGIAGTWDGGAWLVLGALGLAARRRR